MSVLITKLALFSLRNPIHQVITKSYKLSKTFTPLSGSFTSKIVLVNLSRNFSCCKNAKESVAAPVALENMSVLMTKKIVHKKVSLEELPEKDGQFVTIAYATANLYDLKSLKEALIQQKLYTPESLKSNGVGDVVVANAVYSVGTEPREIFFFREGAVVFWNCSHLEASNVLDFVRRFEMESYPRDVIEKEKEVMTYVYQTNAKRCYLQESCFVLVPDRDNDLERYTFSHAMAQSARLGAYEARLAQLAAAVRSASGEMERAGTAHIDKELVVRKLGELFSLRHRLNVESDLLDTPDFYWEEEELERLYSGTVAYFTIPKRTRVLNERLAHCVELLQLVSSWAADRHHIRLEWMIIVLILVEVCFELMHFFDRLFGHTDRRRGRAIKVPIFGSEMEESMFQDLTIVDT